MERLDFPKDFVWGTATASYQVEGATREGGRSDSIWDVFARKPEAVQFGENGDVACDQYHRYEEDVALMSELGLNSYRFSIAWPRIIPTGTGKVNPEGVAYYRKLCEELHKKGITACATIYHWDLPQVLQDAGGWADRSIVDAFREYTKVCYKEFGDLIDIWITINEPLCIAYLGYFHGAHAPGVKDQEKALAAVHHINMAHGAAVQEHRAAGLKTPIGITWNASNPRPATNREEDKKAVKTARAFDTEIFMFPCLGKGYPEIVTKELGLKFPVKDGDMELISQPIDFIGLNFYCEYPESVNGESPYKFGIKPSWQDTTIMGWPITPGGLGRLLEWTWEVSKGAFGKEEIPIYITENGCACDDVVTQDAHNNDRVHDKDRIKYLQQHLAVCADVIKKGVPLKGYYVWSLLDNFEWAFGYSRRFGIIHVDFKSLKRTIKDSGYFLRDVIAGYGEW